MNEIFPLALTLSEYLELALATGSRFQDASAGPPAARRKGRAYAAERMVPSWKKPRWNDFGKD